MAKKTETNGERTVRVKIPITREDKEAVFVSVNDKTWLIKRGADVDVPLCVAETLQNMEDMIEAGMRYQEAVQN